MAHRAEVEIATAGDAVAALGRAWPGIVEDCRRVATLELHYHAIAFSRLRSDGRVPLAQLATNVHLYFNPATTPLVQRARGEIKPDLAICRPGGGGCFGKAATKWLRRSMLLAIEAKAVVHGSGKAAIRRDICKLVALRKEVEALGGSVTPVFWLINTPRTPRPWSRDRMARLHRLASDKKVGFVAVSHDDAATLFDPAP